MELTINQQILKSIHGKKGRIKIGGLYVEGSMEGYVNFHWNDNHGLTAVVPMQWNTFKITEDVIQIIVRANLDKDITLSWDDREKMIEQVKSLINTSWVQAAHIYPASIEKIELATNDKTKEITRMKIYYKDSLIEIFIYS